MACSICGEELEPHRTVVCEHCLGPSAPPPRDPEIERIFAARMAFEAEYAREKLALGAEPDPEFVERAWADAHAEIR